MTNNQHDLTCDVSGLTVELLTWLQWLEHFGADKPTVQDLYCAIDTIMPQLGLVVDTMINLTNTLPPPSDPRNPELLTRPRRMPKNKGPIRRRRKGAINATE